MAIQRLKLVPVIFAALTTVALAAPPVSPSDPATLRGLDLRARNSFAAPFSATTIYIDTVVVHHGYAEQSTIAWRDEAGVWRISKVSETGPGGLLPAPRKLEGKSEKTLSKEVSRELDRLVVRRNLSRDKLVETPPTGIGAPFHTMEIITAKYHAKFSWGGRLLERPGRVADILLND
jgi:hypothetical protein